MARIAAALAILAAGCDRREPAVAPEPPPAVLVSERAGFRLALPPGFPAATESADADGHATWDSIGPAGACMASCIEQAGEDDAGTLEGIAEGVRLGRHPARVTGRESFDHRGHPGRRIRCTRGAGGRVTFGRYDFVQAGGRIYIVGFVGATADAVESPAVRAYFDSFELLR